MIKYKRSGRPGCSLRYRTNFVESCQVLEYDESKNGEEKLKMDLLQLYEVLVDTDLERTLYFTRKTKTDSEGQTYEIKFCYKE